MEIAKIAQAIDTFYGEYDRYPTSDEGLAVLVEKSDKFADGLLNKMPLDPWKHPYEYNYPGQNAPYELMGFVAATVTVQLSGRLSQAALGQAVSQWEFTDAQLRLRARQKGRPVTLHLELGSNRLECALDPDDDAARTVRTLGRGVKLMKFRSATREVTYGPLAIEFTDRGSSETYVVELEGRQG